MQNAEFIKDFIEEALSHADQFEAGLLNLGSEQDYEVINGIFRNVHSIKGTASFFNLENIVKLSHYMENLLGEIRNGKMEIDRELVDLLLSSNDCLKTMISDVEGSENVDTSVYIASLSARMEGKSPQDQPKNENIASKATNIQTNSNINWAVTRGQRLFLIDLDQLDNGEEIIEKVKTIGQIAGIFNREGSQALPDCQFSPERHNKIAIATVLDKSFLPLAIDISEDRIVEIEDLGALSQGEATVGENIQAPENTPVLSPLPPNVHEEIDGQSKKSTALAAEESIRVHISLLNDLLNLASEMVLGRNQLLRTLDAYRKDINGLNAVLQNIDSITTELQEKIMQTRMQPVAKVFNKFPRIIRELSQKMGKEINLHIEGADVELDKSIIEALGDPLTHLVRNAADHGIERPDDREASGKPRTGNVVLKAYHEGGHVNIDIHDDGRGMDIDKIKAKALEKGIIQVSEIPLMGERELLELLFRPGFSTAEKVTDVSGRGVGMDVVKTNIEKLGGTMEIMTTLARNTIVRLTLPLTLAIISSLVVEVEGQKFALPQVNLQGLIRIKPGDKTRKIEKIRGSDVLRYRGKLLPVVHLADVLSLRETITNNEGILRVLVIKSGSKLFGLMVDTIHDGEEILVKHVPRYLNDCQCYSGVTIMGNGRTAMILDPEGIIAKAGLRFMDEQNDLSAKETVFNEHSITERQNLLLFKCSGPETLSLDLSLVARVEKIDAGQIEKIGKREYIQFRGEAIRIIRPENYLPIGKGRNTSNKLYVIIPKIAQYQMGILIDKIIDTTEYEVKFNQDDIRAKGLVGSAILDGRIVLFVNIYELFEMADPKKNLTPDTSTEALAGKTVLLAEDTPFFIKMEKKYLETAGYTVLAAINGKEAWKMLQENTVDAVISDIEMPAMDGYELVRKIRADRRLANLPVIAVTSRADQSSVKKGMEAGFDFYEIKLDRERLLEKLRQAFEKRGDAV